jgi:hypothetical protein
MQRRLLRSVERDFAFIGGVRIDLDTIVEPSFVRASDRLSNEFARNAPFPHIVLDGLISPALLDVVRDEFDVMPRTEWQSYNTVDEVKRGSVRGARFGPGAELYFNTIHSRAFVQFLERVTGVPGLVQDPILKGGGMHEIPDGGRFAPHLDFNRHPVTGLYNRLVFITYLNRDWQRSYGGALELWDFESKTKMVEIDPLFGRTVIFAQSPQSLHGHPVPVHAPDRRPRRSVAAYYYTKDRPEGFSSEFRTTRFSIAPQPWLRGLTMRTIKYVTPPIAIDVARRIRSALRPRK